MVRRRTAWADGPAALVKVTVEVGNTTDWPTRRRPRDRDEAAGASLVAVHTLLAVDDGTFVSAARSAGVRPPRRWPAAAATGRSRCSSARSGDADVVLSSPIILYDHPAVAPESAGDFCDATEIDEILALRVLTLTDDEKAEARGTDARAAAIVDRCDDLPPEVWARLHGAVRSLRPVEERRSRAMAPSSPLRCRGGTRESTRRSTRGPTPRGSAGSRSPRARRCVCARRGEPTPTTCSSPAARPTVAGVFQDVDGAEHVAVTLDDDPASELFEWQRRYLYFHPDEVEVLA